MKIDGVDIIWVSADGIPIKSHFPEALKERLKTKNQWLELGCVPKEDTVGYECHPSAMAYRTSIYYLDKDVEPIGKDTMIECCGTCMIRDGRYCVVAGDYVRMQGRCSEWQSE